MEAIVFVSSPPRSFDILTSAWEQRETKESQRGRFADRERNIEDKVRGTRPMKGAEHRS